jgi:hypothetical protein
VARTLCVVPTDGGPARVHLLQGADAPDRALDRDELVPDEELFDEVAAYLDERRMIGTRVDLVPVDLRAVSVMVHLVASRRSKLERVEADVLRALYRFINPLVGGSPAGIGPGWPFGRGLNQGELFGIVHGVPGVEGVTFVRMYETDLRTGERRPEETRGRLVLDPHELLASGAHQVEAVYEEHRGP